MKEFELEIRLQPQPEAREASTCKDGGELPHSGALNGRPGYINFLDALNSWQLVKELKAALKPARRDVLQARESHLRRRGRSRCRKR
jgi:hypothetical protein